MKIEIKILDNLANGLPTYATPGSVAMDLICTKDIVLFPQERVMIATGIAIHIGHTEHFSKANGMGIAGLILPRSGLGTRGLVLANTIGLIDEDYQGELLVSAWNSLQSFKRQHQTYEGVYNGEEENNIKLKAGDRFAQLMFLPIVKAQLNVVEEFSHTTHRGSGGFGSTGL